MGARSDILSAYGWGQMIFGLQVSSRWFPTPVHVARELGCYCAYANENPHTGRKKRQPVNVDEMVKRWHEVVVGLTVAHDKDEADAFEAKVDALLAPFLIAPVKQIREFVPKLAKSLQEDKRVPYLVWKAYEVYASTFESVEDEDVITLKTELATDIARMVESDVKEQIVPAMVRALQWRSPEKLEKVKEVVEREKAAGRGVRLKGRESCLFIEAGGTEDQPEVCVQV